MKTIILYILIFNINLVYAQNIIFLGDSVLINDRKITSTLTKPEFDEIMGLKGKVTVKKKDYSPCSNDEISKVTTYFYYNFGIFYRTYECDTTKFSIGIKLKRENDLKKDKRHSELTETFRGILVVGNDTIIKNGNVIDERQLKTTSITRRRIRVGEINQILGGDLNYKDHLIRLSFDGETEEFTQLFIHYNFPKK